MLPTIFCSIAKLYDNYYAYNYCGLLIAMALLLCVTLIIYYGVFVPKLIFNSNHHAHIKVTITCRYIKFFGLNHIL